MTPNPDPFLRHLRMEGYHSRSNKHSNALAEAIVDDLLGSCPPVTRLAARGALVYDLNFTISARTSDWNVDLVLGAPPPGTAPPEGDPPIRRARPSSVHVAIEIKSVMTEHRKAVKNRKRDLEAHHQHVHQYDNRAIAGGVLVINGSETFQSPLRPTPTAHRRPRELVEHCLRELRGVSVRRDLRGEGLDAKCAIVVLLDNIHLPAARFLDQPPAPSIGDPLHYDAFIQRLCSLYEERFARPD